MNSKAKELLAKFEEPNSELDFRIRTNTELHRKGFVRVALVDSEGREIEEHGEIRFRQLSHDYKFGANLFMLGQFPTEEENALYEERFRNVFNLGVVPFYWSDLEPNEGRPRYAKDSPPIYRRPPPDRVVEFCEQYGITPKGHPLFWHGWMPDWLPADREDWLRRMDRHIAEIAERYGDRIYIFDAINEAIGGVSRENSFYVEDIARIAFEVTRRHLPNAQLVLNDDQYWWVYRRELTNCYLIAKDLIQRGIRIGGLGFQYHMFDWNLRDADRFMLNPVNLYNCLDLYGRLEVPCSLTEISLISRKDLLGDGDAFQEKVLDKLYRLWFSHPATEALIYWNLVDDTAADGEDVLRSGLLNRDLSAKAAYRTLDHLVNHEWRSAGAFPYAPGGDNRFQGFYGEYEIEIKLNTGTYTRQITMSPRTPSSLRVKL